MPDAPQQRAQPERSIKSLDAEGIRSLVAEIGEPKYRAEQIMRWLYQRGVTSYDEMTDLPTGLRERLGDRWAVHFPEKVKVQASTDGTRKYLLRLSDGVTIETVGLPAGDRLTVCFSTQAGCAMGCSFCATGTSGLTRSLSPGEMVDQLTTVSRDFGRRITNAVAMGQGEPFSNYDCVLAALRFMNSADGVGIGARHLTVSTCGLLTGVRRFADEPEQFTLAVSLHSAVQATRDRLMPGVKGLPLEQLRQAIAEYTDKTGRRCSLEYALIEGVNDTEQELEELVSYCRGLLVHVNLIPMNPVTEAALRRAGARRVVDFEERLARSGINVSVRAERGADIDAACGQLRQRHASE